MDDIIRTEELDAIVRLGFNDLRNYYSAGATEETKQRANFTLRLLRAGTVRMSALTNRAAVAFKIAKAIGAPADEVAPLWRQIANASGAAAQKKQETVATEARQQNAAELASEPQVQPGRRDGPLGKRRPAR